MRAPLLAALIGLAACSTSRATPTSTPAEIPPTSGHGGGASQVDGKPMDDDASQIVGHPAPEWTVRGWINSAPLGVAELRGKVVFVRWFMGTACPMCSASAPTLKDLYARYADRGLKVIGMYHHKDPEPLTEELVRKHVEAFGYAFPVGIDEDWRTLKRYWLDGHDHRSFTSVSFLIDKRGVVRHVHLGGRLAPTDKDYEAIRGYIERLLAE